MGMTVLHIKKSETVRNHNQRDDRQIETHKHNFSTITKGKCLHIGHNVTV